MLIRSTLAAILSLFLFIGSTDAAVIVQPVGISSPQGSNDPPVELSGIIDQSGLSAPYASGVDSFALVTSTTTHSSTLADPNAGTTRTPFVDENPQQLTFDLGAVLPVNGIAVWAMPFGNQYTTFELFADDDADFSNGLGASLATGAIFFTLDNPQSAQTYSFTPVATQYIHINATGIIIDLAPVGVGEVAFSAVPEPSAFLYGGLAAGLAGCAYRVKRRLALSRPPTS